MTQRPSIYIPEVRRAWARVDATTLAGAGARLGLTHSSIKSRRDRYPHRFPAALPVGASGLSAISVYSFHELYLMAVSDWDINTVPLTAAALRRQVDHYLEIVQPVTLAVIAKRCNQELTVIRSTWRGGREANKGSIGNGFPFALQLGAVHTMSTMIYSWPEVVAWTDWSLGEGFEAEKMKATNMPPLAEFMEGIEEDDTEIEPVGSRET